MYKLPVCHSVPAHQSVHLALMFSTLTGGGASGLEVLEPR